MTKTKIANIFKQKLSESSFKSKEDFLEDLVLHILRHRQWGHALRTYLF